MGYGTVPEIPEPATWALMFLGLAFIGSALRAVRAEKRMRLRRAAYITKRNRMSL